MTKEQNDKPHLKSSSFFVVTMLDASISLLLAPMNVVVDIQGNVWARPHGRKFIVHHLLMLIGA